MAGHRLGAIVGLLAVFGQLLWMGATAASCDLSQWGSEFVYNGITVGASFDFGISASFFTFVPTGNFCDPHPGRFRVDAAHVPAVFHQTTVINNFDFHNHVFVNHGIDPQHITAVTRVPIHPGDDPGIFSSPVMRGAVVTRNQTLVINRPRFTGTAVTTMHQGVAPHEVNLPNASHTWYTTQPQQNNHQPVETGQPNRNAPNPPVVDQNINHQQPQNYQHPQTTQPANTWNAPRQTYQTTPSQPQNNHNQQVETPARTPSVNEPSPHTTPEPPARSESPYRENQEPMPQSNNSQGQRYRLRRAHRNRLLANRLQWNRTALRRNQHAQYNNKGNRKGSNKARDSSNRGKDNGRIKMAIEHMAILLL